MGTSDKEKTITIARATAGGEEGSRNGCSCWLGQLPNEVILEILYYLDEYDLLSMTRVDHGLRALACDDCLHKDRLIYSKKVLDKWLLLYNRRGLTDPKDNGQLMLRYLIKRNPIATRVHMVIIKTRLNRRLRFRPKRTDIHCNILTSEFYYKRNILQRAIIRDKISKFIRESLSKRMMMTCTGIKKPQILMTNNNNNKSSLSPSLSCPHSNTVSYLIRWFKVREKRYNNDYWFSQYIKVENQRKSCPTRAKVHNMTLMFEKLNVI